MSKKLIIWLIVLFLLLVATVCLLVFHNFYSPGVHCIGSSFHLEVSSHCYLITPEDGIIGESYLAIDGTATDRFIGYIFVDAYPIPISIPDKWPYQHHKYDSDGIVLDYGKYRFVHYFKPYDNHGFATEYIYQLKLDPNNPEDFMIYILKDNESVCCAVPAFDEETAMAIYENLTQKS